jgi:hypothetical protein
VTLAGAFSLHAASGRNEKRTWQKAKPGLPMGAGDPRGRGVMDGSTTETLLSLARREAHAAFVPRLPTSGFGGRVQERCSGLATAAFKPRERPLRNASPSR